MANTHSPTAALMEQAIVKIDELRKENAKLAASHQALIDALEAAKQHVEYNKQGYCMASQAPSLLEIIDAALSKARETA